MKISRVVNVSIDIAGQMFCDFQAQEITSKSGSVFMEIDDEKKIVKNGLAIALYPEPEPYITFKVCGLYFSMKCYEGRIDVFLGEYEVSLFNRQGKVVISNVED